MRQLHEIAAQRQANVRLDNELTATMKHKIEDTQTRTRVYNDLKSHHKGQMEFLRSNAHLQDSEFLPPAAAYRSCLPPVERDMGWASTAAMAMRRCTGILSP